MIGLSTRLGSARLGFPLVIASTLPKADEVPTQIDDASRRYSSNSKDIEFCHI